MSLLKLKIYSQSERERGGGAKVGGKQQKQS